MVTPLTVPMAMLVDLAVYIRLFPSYADQPTVGLAKLLLESKWHARVR